MKIIATILLACLAVLTANAATSPLYIRSTNGTAYGTTTFRGTAASTNAATANYTHFYPGSIISSNGGLTGIHSIIQTNGTMRLTNAHASFGNYSVSLVPGGGAYKDIIVAGDGTGIDLQSTSASSLVIQNQTTIARIGASSAMPLRLITAETTRLELTANGSAATFTVTDLVNSGQIRATNGFASYSTITAETIAATGWTNNWVTNNCTVYLTATAVSWVIKNRSQTTLYTSPTLTATMPVHLQPGWSVTAASGLAGTAVPE